MAVGEAIFQSPGAGHRPRALCVRNQGVQRMSSYANDRLPRCLSQPQYGAFFVYERHRLSLCYRVVEPHVVEERKFIQFVGVMRCGGG